MQDDAPVKPWKADDRFSDATEYHVYSDSGKLLGTWYGQPGNLRWSQFCNRCNEYFTRVVHMCPQVVNPCYAGTPAVPPTHAPTFRDPLQDKPGRRNNWSYTATLACGHSQSRPIGKPPIHPCEECTS